MASRARGWCFTLNAPTGVEDYSLCSADYAVVGLETAPTTGQVHHQGYMYFKNPVRFSTMREKVPGAHLEIAKGTGEQNRVYCTKEAVYFEAGTCPAAGKRTDLDEVRDLVNEGGTMADVCAVGSSYQSLRAGQLLLSVVETPRTTKPRVVWLWGATGCGKSRRAFEEFPDAWVSSGTLTWFDGYDGHEAVILDDWRDHHAPLSTMLRLLDRYPYRVPYKGGFRQWKPLVIIITSNRSPTDEAVYRGVPEDKGQLLRRIDEIVEL